MPTTSEKNLFRRLIGDYGRNTIDDPAITAMLDDATFELTADFTTPVTTFDSLVRQYHPEVIYWAAINYWWNKAATLQAKTSHSMGDAANDVTVQFDRAMQMISELRTRYDTIQLLGTDITIGNLTRFSKTHLYRFGGRSEEDAMNG